MTFTLNLLPLLLLRPANKVHLAKQAKTMFFTLPNLACGHLRRGFDTISVNFQQNASDRNVYTNSTSSKQRTPVQSDNTEDRQPKKDAVSHYSASWDMMETPAAASAPRSFSPSEPLLLRLSLLGGPRTRRWSLDQVHMVTSPASCR